MARQFNGDNQYGTAAGVDLSGVNKITISLWLYWDSFFNDSDKALDFVNSAVGGFDVQPNNSSGNFQVTLQGNVGFCAAQFTRPSAGTWHHYLILMDKSKASNEVDSVYIDNSSQSLSYAVNANNTDNFRSDTLTFMRSSAGTFYGSGRLCEVAIWPGVLLDTAEIAALSKGISPILIRPSAKPYYWPLYGHPTTGTNNTTDTEPELFYGKTVTLAGDATHTPPSPVEGPPLISATLPQTVGRRTVVTETISPTGILSLSGSLTKMVGKSQSGTEALTGTLASALPRTRLYFSSVTGASAAPAYDAGWNYTTEASRWRLKHTKGTSAMANGTQIGAWLNTAGQKALDRQYVSNPLDGAQNVGGSIKGQLLVQENANTDNVDQIIVVIKVVSIDGGTLRGTVLSIGSRGPTGEFRSAGFRNKIIADGDTGSIVAAQDGDRIVVEIGYSNSGAGTTPEALARWGENSADLPENETQTADGAGWIEFANTLVFQNDAAGGLETGGDLTPAGSLVNQPELLPVGSVTPAGTLAARQTGHLSAAGTLTDAGAAIVLQVQINSGNAGELTPSGALTTSFGRGVAAAAALALSGAVQKIPGIVRGGAAAFASGVKYTAGKALGNELPLSGDLTPMKLFNALADGTLALAGTLANVFAKAFSGTLTTAGTLSRTFGKYFTGVLDFFGITGVTQSTGDVGTCTVSTADLIARVYERLGEDATATVIGYQGTYYTLAEVTHALTLAQRLFAWLTLSLEHRASFSLSAGQTFPSLRTQIPDFWAPLKISLQSGPRLLPITLDDLDKYDEDWQTASGTPRYYCTMGFNFMAIYPTPSAPVSLHVTYAAEPQAITQYGGVVEIPTDSAPLLVDGALFVLRLKEGGTELQSVLQNLDRFVKGAQRYRQYIEARSKGQLYDSQPKELSLFDLSRFKFRPPREKK